MFSPLHVFEFEALGFAGVFQDEEGRNEGEEGIDAIGPTQADAGEHDGEQHGDAEIGDPLGEAADGEARSTDLVREHLAEQHPHERAPRRAEADHEQVRADQRDDAPRVGQAHRATCPVDHQRGLPGGAVSAHIDAKVVAARQAHFGRAAETCAISQPALSAQIAALETAIGHQLFERGARQVRLTTFGEQFGIRARSILREAEALADMARGAGGSALGRLRIGVIPTIAPYLLPSVIGHITAAHPEIDLLVRETMTHKLIEELGDGKLDCAIVALPVSEPSLTEVALFDEAMVLVRPADDAHRPVPDMDTLGQMKLLLLEERILATKE